MSGPTDTRNSALDYSGGSFVMTGGDPYYATLFLPLLTYEEAFDRFRFGAGSALMLLTFLLSVLIIGAIYLLFRRRGDVADV